MEINDFKNFEEFLVYSSQHGEKMKYWDTEKIKSFCDKVSKLIEESPEFKEKYEKWTRKMELKEKAKNARIKIGGTPEENASTKAYLRLKKIKQEAQDKKRQATSKSTFVPSGKIIEI